MSLTTGQLTTLGTAIRTNLALVDALAAGNLGDIRDWYNAQASPAFYIWRISMPIQEMRDEHFDWTEIVDNLTTNNLLALQVLTDQDTVDPSRASIRGAFGSIFSGPQLVKTRTALLAASKRIATAVQQLFADGTGTEEVPATAMVEGPLSTTEVDRALELTA